MNFIAPWKEICFRFNSPTFWRINLLATLNGLFFASLTVNIAEPLYGMFISEMTGIANLPFLKVFIFNLIFSLLYVGIIFRFVAIQTIAFFIRICLCNLFLNANRWATIVYYTLLILPLIADPTLPETLLLFFVFLILGVLYAMKVALLFFFIPVCLCNLFLNTNRWGTIVYYTLLTTPLIFCLIPFLYPFLSTRITVIYSVSPGPILGYTLWRYCLLHYTDLKDDDRERLPTISSWEICRPIINVLRNLLVMMIMLGILMKAFMIYFIG
ncbi:hypothetical protein B488_05440 [Liberibacter crescens BT-1]|uniref:Uncharacterized protein n=1 Tax=Liberibacter crescens (strain BT-1) TaxID=1215343 RepID=L0EVZ3_LIBCB|nr:hypothetical protein B488_05440 [Liberibacter crescens BT-1]AMC12686.1 hypothetical protein RL73_02830 [Liberibacter crescens]